MVGKDSSSFLGPTREFEAGEFVGVRGRVEREVGLPSSFRNRLVPLVTHPVSRGLKGSTGGH